MRSVRRLREYSMDPYDFVRSIKEAVEDAAIEGTIESLENLPGRKPAKELVENSEWYKSLDEVGKSRVKSIIADSVGSAVFGMFAVLDGVRSISPIGEKNNLELVHHSGQKKTLLNDPDKEFLHDIYNDA